MESWRYYPEKSTNPENSFTIRLFGDDSETVLQEASSNRQFVANF
jgi:hypothetical protein